MKSGAKSDLSFPKRRTKDFYKSRFNGKKEHFIGWHNDWHSGIKHKAMSNMGMVWMHPGFEERERNLMQKGYFIRKIEAGNTCRLYDEIPDIIIFSEESLTEQSLFFKLNQFFPEAIALCVREESPAKHEIENSQKSAAERLINEIKGIETGD